MANTIGITSFSITNYFESQQQLCTGYRECLCPSAAVVMAPSGGSEAAVQGANSSAGSRGL